MRTCSRCIMDDTAPRIEFNGRGECSFCKIYDTQVEMYPIDQPKVQEMVKRIKKDGGKCIVGVSGGVDSSYVLYLAKKYGLDPTAVNVANGWDTEIAERNVKNLVKRMDVHLLNVKLDEKMVMNLMKSFLMSGTPDCDCFNDMAIHKIIMEKAQDIGTKWVIVGKSFRTEGKCPLMWAYGSKDWKYIKAVHRRFINSSLKDFPKMSLRDIYRYSKNFNVFRIFNHHDNPVKKVKETLEKECGWKDYGLKHGENKFTKFLSFSYLPAKFGIDKRKIYCSALIRSGQMTRKEALKEIEKKLDTRDIDQEVEQRLDINVKELIQSPNKTFFDYPNSYNFMLKIGKIMGNKAQKMLMEV